MEQKYLIVVDMQNDFVTGTLGTVEAQAIVPNVLQRVKRFSGKVIFTQDTHQEDYLTTQEGKKLPIQHCVQSTMGWRLIPELEELQRKQNFPVYEKPSFASITLAKDLQLRQTQETIASVEIIGLCTDICVISNALLLKAFLPDCPIYVTASCCAGTTPENHFAALRVMESCQIVVQSKEEGF